MPTFKLTLAYDGTGFVGWQRQASGTSIQGLIEDAMSDLDGRHVTAVAAGRTDAGVHARGQVVSATLVREIDGPTLVRALNARLPAAVRVLAAAEAPLRFHARFDARSKTYQYRLWNGEVISPFERGYVWHVPAPPLDVARMAQAASSFEGRHDFAAFQAAGSEVRTTERTIFFSRLWGAVGSRGRAESPDSDHLGRLGLSDALARGTLITFEIAGDGFLRHMVRTMIGTLVEVGRSRRAVEWVSELLASCHRAHAGPTAPPEGLFLIRVDYSEPVL